MAGFNQEKPYNDLPLLPPKTEVDSKSILKQCIKSRSALAELKIAGDLIPNQDILINNLPLLESKDSSEIENIVTTTDELFKFSNTNDKLADSATKEALRYRAALYKGYESLKKRPLCTHTAIEVCSLIKNVNMDIRKVPGTTLANPKTQELIYTPPEGESILRDKLSNWEKFLHENEDIDPLVRLAIGHYQFEAIHPFTDGNGRTGRILNILFLIQEQLLNIPILYISHYIVKNKKDYYKLLINVTRENDWEPWILYMLKAIEETSMWTVQKINKINKLFDATANQVKNELPKIYSRELIEVMFQQPYCRISNLIDSKIAKREAASQYLKKICSIKILEEVKIGKEKIFINRKLMEILTSE